MTEPESSNPSPRKCGCVCHKVGLLGLMCCPCTKQWLDEVVNGKPGTPQPPAFMQEMQSYDFEPSLEKDSDQKKS